MKEKLVAAFAVLISVCALFVSIYEASLMRKAQKAAAWPYVEVLYSFGDAYLQMEVTNSGLGPAKLGYLRINWDGEELYEQGIRKKLPEVVGHNRITWSSVEGRVLPPGKTIRFFTVRDSAAVAILNKESDNYDLSLCYCSVFGDCWISKGLVAKPCEGCER